MQLQDEIQLFLTLEGRKQLGIPDNEKMCCQHDSHLIQFQLLVFCNIQE